MAANDSTFLPKSVRENAENKSLSSTHHIQKNASQSTWQSQIYFLRCTQHTPLYLLPPPNSIFLGNTYLIILYAYHSFFKIWKKFGVLKWNCLSFTQRNTDTRGLEIRKRKGSKLESQWSPSRAALDMEMCVVLYCCHFGTVTLLLKQHSAVLASPFLFIVKYTQFPFCIICGTSRFFLEALETRLRSFPFRLSSLYVLLLFAFHVPSSLYIYI